MKTLLLRMAVLSCVAGALVITGCAGVTVKSELNSIEFQEENLPVRTLRVGIFGDGTYSNEDIVQLINQASSALAKQIGVQLEAVYCEPIKLEKSESDLTLDILHNSTLHVSGDVDIAVAFVSGKFFSSLFLWKGVIDDSYRRYIILRGGAEVLIHEIGHCFIFSHSHSSGGVMKPTPNTHYFSPEDRKEILKNKWRDFNVKPDIDEHFKINLLKEDRE